MSIFRYAAYFFLISFFTIQIPFSSYADFDIAIDDVEISEGIVADISVQVFENNAAICQKIANLSENSQIFSFIQDKASIFAVHGAVLNSSYFQPLSQALFNNNPTGSIVCRVVGIDQAGHGASGLPEGDILFGELSLENYANTLLNTLRDLANDSNIAPKSLIAHSTGGIATQVAQQILSGQGSNFRDEFDIRRVTLFASVPSAPVSFPIGQEIADLLEGFANCFSGPGNPLQGGCEPFDIEPDGDVDWDDIQTVDTNNTIFDCDPNTVPVGIADPPPDCEDPSARGDRLPVGALGGTDEEPLNVVRQNNGVDPQIRPSTDSGIFNGASNTTLQVVAFENDTFVGAPEVQEDLFLHLTSSVEPSNEFQTFSGELADHNSIFFNPPAVLDFLAGNIVLP